MTIREAIKVQENSIKNKSFKERLSFFREYYALKTIALLLVLVVAVAFIVSMATQKEYVFTGVFFGAEAQHSSQEYLNAFAQTANIDLKDCALTVQTSPDIRMDQQISTEIYQHMETFSAMVSAQSVSCFAGNPDLFLYYAYLGYATDLRTVLSDEDLTALSPYLYYMDAQLVLEQENASGGYTDAYMQRPDPTKPDQMADPIPVGISLTAASDAFSESYHFAGNSLIGICKSSEYPELAQAFLRHCLSLPY